MRTCIKTASISPVIHCETCYYSSRNPGNVTIFYSLPRRCPLNVLLHVYPIQCLQSNPPECPVDNIVLHLVTALICDEEYKLLRSSLYMIFGILLLRLSFIITFSSSTYSQRPSVCVLCLDESKRSIFYTK
jgi:hypothetical protein